MTVHLTERDVACILTRTSGYLRSVCSHSVQPYRGCAFGRALCGVGCYVRHNPWLTRNEPWGSFLEARRNAAESYRERFDGERRWARRSRGGFSLFMSSSTDPFVPQEDRFGVTRNLLEAMCELPPDALIVQTHTHRVAGFIDVLQRLSRACELRVHLSIESDRERLPGLPPPASSVERRFEAAVALREAGLRVIVTVAPLLPIRHPERFFQRIARVADGVVLDHFIGGDGSPDGGRTRRTALPQAMAEVDPASVSLGYREAMLDVARQIMPGRVGCGIDGFAGRFPAAGQRLRESSPGV